MKTRIAICLFTALCGFASAVQVRAQGTAFTYQGRLNDGPAPANGLYDFNFSVFAVTNGGTAFAGPLTHSAVAVSNGLFTTLLDFGGDLFDGPGPVLLEIAVRPSGGGTFTTLSPRQLVTPAPHAISASLAFQAVNASNVGDNAAVRSLNNLRNEVTLAAGQNVTITPSGNTLTIASPAGGVGPWQVSGSNTFYNTGNVGIGTASPLTRLHVKGTEEGIRIDGPAVGAANLAYMSFRASNGTRIGYVGDGSSGDTGVFLASDAGDVGLINAVSGRVLTAKTNGRVGIGTTTPQANLEVRGDIRLGASGELRAPGGEENLRIVRGVFGATGNIIVGSGFSVSRGTTGSYDITFNTPFTGAPAVTATANFDASSAAGDAFVMTEGVNVSTAHLRVVVGGGGGVVNIPIHFIAIGPR